MKVLNKFPNFRQAYNYDCGATVAQAVLAYYGMDWRKDKIMKKAGTTTAGTPITGIKKIVIGAGLKLTEGTLSIDNLKQAIDKGRPVIVALQAWTKKKQVNWKTNWSDGHYVVAIGYDKNKIIFADPSVGQRTFLTESELLDRWHDQGADGKKYLNYGMIVYGKKGGFDFEKAVHLD